MSRNPKAPARQPRHPVTGQFMPSPRTIADLTASDLRPAPRTTRRLGNAISSNVAGRGTGT